MLRQLMAVLVSSALVFGSVSTTAMSAPMQTSASIKNQSPLPPGGAAGIRQAQGSQIDPLLAIGIVAGLFLVGVLLIGDSTDDDNNGVTTTSTTGTF